MIKQDFAKRFRVINSLSRSKKKLLQSKERDKPTGFDRINVVEDYQRSRIRASQVEKSTTREKPYIIASMSAASSGIPRAD